MATEEQVQKFIEQIKEDISEYGRGRQNDVVRGAETPVLAALLVQKYGYGLIKAVQLVLECFEVRFPEVEPPFLIYLDQVVEEIDPNWRENMQARWDSRPAGLSLKGGQEKC